MSNLFIPVYFQITADNIYQRAWGNWISYVITYGYLLYGIILIYKYRDKTGRYLFMPAVIFMMPVALGSVLQLCFYGLSLLPLGVALSLNSLHINVQNEVSFIDTLSGLYTRQYMNQYLSTAIRKSGGKKMIAGIMLDIDKFKSINDTYGHLVGDEAIMAAGGILLDAVPDNGIAARFAGDEFVIILRADGAADVTDTLQRIQQGVDRHNQSGAAAYHLSFSMGSSFFLGSGDTADAFFTRMDQAMYKNKREKFGDRRKNRGT